MEPGKGYWVKTTDAAILTLDGDVMADEPMLLQSRWNLVGYSCLTAKGREEALSSIAGSYDSVWAYNIDDWERYIPDAPEFLNDLDVMTPGMGYWIDATIDCLWDVNATPPPVAPSMASASKEDRVSTDRPGIPYTIWGSIEAGGVKVTGRDECIVVLKVGGVTQTSYQLGVVKQYGDYYALDVPSTSTSFPQAELHVQVRNTVTKVPVPLGIPGQVIRVDLSIRATPRTNMLHQNFPNPFNPDTWIPYQLLEDAHVVIRIYKVTGQLVRTLDLGRRPAGYYTSRKRDAFWNGRDEEGESVSSGIYFIYFEAGSFFAMRKVVMIR